MLHRGATDGAFAPMRGVDHRRKEVFLGMQRQDGGQRLRQLRQGRQPTGETVLTRWVGHLVVLKYLAGPADPADPDDPRNLAEAEPEARSGIFHFQRFGQLGIEICNEMEDGLLNRVTFIPWGAVLSIRGTTPEERAASGGRLTREQVAELAQRDNI
jgi:hypothetical protein